MRSFLMLFVAVAVGCSSSTSDEGAVDSAVVDTGHEDSSLDSTPGDSAPNDSAPADSTTDSAPTDSAPADSTSDVHTDSSDGGADLAAKCTATGGTVGTAMCCTSEADFPNNCGVGGCACAPSSSHSVKICTCGTGKCWDGTTCK